MEEDFRELCDRLWFVLGPHRKVKPRFLRSGVGEDLQQGEGQMSLIPLVYDHPFRGDKTMCFHLGLGQRIRGKLLRSNVLPGFHRRGAAQCRHGGLRERALLSRCLIR